MTSDKNNKYKYFEPFLTKEYGGYYYIYYFDLTLSKRRKKSTRTRHQSEAFRILQKFKSSYLNNYSSKSINSLTELRDVINKYYSNIYSKGTLSLYNMSLNDLIKIISNKPLRMVTYRDLILFMNERVKYASETTCNIELKTLRSSFNIAIKLGEINENPANAVKQFIVPEKTNFCFSNEEITQLLNVMGNHFIRNVTLLAIYTGARRGEIANLQWQDIDFENRVIHIRNKETFTTKTRKERDIPISDDLHLLLQELRGIKDESNLINFRNPEDYVIAKNEGGKYSGSHLSRLFKRFLRKAGLDEKYHLHIIRHYAQSTLSNKNVPIYQIQQISGSSNLTTTLGYLHTRMEDLRKAVNLIKVN